MTRQSKSPAPPESRPRRTASNPKLSPPDATTLFDRLRLHAILDQALGAVAWIIGPAGAGKTSLLATWTRASRFPVIWYRVDSGDRDPAHFLQTLALGLRAGKRRRLPRFEPEHLANLDTYARSFFRAWYEQAGAAILILDNLHEAYDGGLVRMLPTLLDECPAVCTLVLSSRTELPSVLSGLAADPAHLRLGYSDLRCSIEEAESFAEQTGRAPLPLSSLAQADGWMAGVALLLRQARVPAGKDAKLLRLSPGKGVNAGPGGSGLASTTLFNRFAREAFDGLSTVAQDVLLANAFSPWIDTAMTDHLLGIRGSDRVLDALWQAHFFIERGVGRERRPVFTCHSLLTAFLRERIRRRWSDAELDALWERQAEAFSACGDRDAALALSLAVGRCSTAGRLLIELAPVYLRQGRLVNWLESVRQLGQASHAHEAPLAWWQGRFLQMVDPPAALLCLERAHATWLARHDLRGALRAVAAMLDVYFVQWKQWEEALHWAGQAQQLHDSLHGDYGTEADAAAIVASGGSLMFMSPDHPLVLAWYTRASELIAASDDDDFLVTLASFTMGYALWIGDMNQARSISQRALRALDRRPRQPADLTLMIWIALVGMSDGHACDAARRRVIEEALELADKSGVHLMDFHLRFQQVQRALLLGDCDAGRRAFKQLLALDPGTRATDGLVLTARMFCHMLDGELVQASDLALDALKRDPSFGGWIFGRYVLQMHAAQALVIQQRHVEAQACADELLRVTATWDVPCLKICANLILAATALARADSDRASRHLRFALPMARGQGYLTFPYSGLPQFLARLLAHALTCDIEPAWVRQHIREQHVPAPASCLSHWPYSVRITVLGSFSLQVEGRTMDRHGRTKQRVLELLKALGAHGGIDIPNRVLASALWPGDTEEAALAALAITLHRARQLLGRVDAIEQKGGQLSFNPAWVDLDLWRFEQLLVNCEAQLAAQQPDRPRLVELAEALARDMPTDLLANEHEWPWLLGMRQAWNVRAIRVARRMAYLCLGSGESLHGTLSTEAPVSAREAKAALLLAGRLAERDDADEASQRLHDAALSALER